MNKLNSQWIYTSLVSTFCFLLLISCQSATSLDHQTQRLQSPGIRYFQDNFEDRLFTTLFWKQECRASSVLPQFVTIEQGICNLMREADNQFLRMIWVPWSYRVKKDLNYLRGGSEIKENPQTIYSGPGKPGWDNIYGTAYPTMNRDLWYSWRFRVNDMSALQKDIVPSTHSNLPDGSKQVTSPTTLTSFAKAAWIGQWHHRKQNSCYFGATYYPPGVSPVVGVLLKAEGDHAVIEIKTKQPNMPYYRGGRTCGDFCSVTLAQVKIPRSTFLGQWNQLAFHIRWAPLKSMDDGVSVSPPSLGYIEIYLNGKPLRGSATHHLSWVRSQTRFRGIRTILNRCSNFLKLGLYVNGYDSRLDPFRRENKPLTIIKEPVPTLVDADQNPMIRYDYKGRKISIDYDDVRVGSALDVVSSQAQQTE